MKQQYKMELAFLRQDYDRCLHLISKLAIEKEINRIEEKLKEIDEEDN